MYNPHPCADIKQGAFANVDNKVVIETVMQITPTFNNYTVNTFRCIDDDNTAPNERWFAQKVITHHTYNNQLKLDFTHTLQL